MTTAAALTREEADAAVASLEERAARIAGDTAPDPAASAERLGRLECDLLATLGGVRAIDPQLAAATGHPVLADASQWRDLAGASSAPSAARAADDLVARLIDDEAQAWQQRALERSTDATANACFRTLAEARGFDLEALSRRRAEAPPLAGTRPALREALRAAVAREPPAGKQRRAWATELLDRANVVLTGVDELDPDRAAAQLRLVAGELDWHVDAIETGRGPARSRLRRKARRLRAEQQERELQHRLEARFGTRKVASFERLILYLILLVLLLFGYEAFGDPSREEIFWLTVTDTFACAIFLIEFFLKLSMVTGRARWFARHFLTDFLPSIPFGMISFGLEWLHKADALRSVRAIRFLRLGRLARYVRILRPTIRLVRALGFLTRGIDRVVRRYGELLNRNIVLYPTREERDVAHLREQGLGHRVRTIQARINERWEGLLVTAPREAREVVAATRVDCIERARRTGCLRRMEHEPVLAGEIEELPAADVLRRLATITPHEVEAQMGQDFVSRVARAVRMLAFSPFRFIPPFAGYLPPLTRGMNDDEVVVAAARKVARRLKRHHDRWFWFADLYGAVTPAQFVDRVGTAMFKGAFRPAYRLALFGLFYLAVKGLLQITHIPGLDAFAENLWDKLGDVLKIVGVICVAILGIGWWLRHIAGQATDFFAQTAKAQFLALTEAVKSRHIERDAKILDRHVFRPERVLRTGDPDGDPDGGSDADRDADGNGCRDRERFVGGVRKWLVEAQAGTFDDERFDAVERGVLLYRDNLDGALLVDSDTRITSQLLGSPALRNLRLLSRRFGRTELAALKKLDLERQKALLTGPYLWFTLICRAVAHGSARLIVDYNRHALPLRQLRGASEGERHRYEQWLKSERVGRAPSERGLYLTTEFHALHFLDDDPARDADVERRFGARLLARLRRDRVHLIRRIFGTYPLHGRPRDQRVINLYRIYQLWFEGGRVLLIGFRILWNAIVFCGRFMVWLNRCIGEIRRPRFAVNADELRDADFAVALRKIQRMRGPAAEACIRLRARFDPEYLGVRLPGTEESGLEGADAEADLEFIGVESAFAQEIDSERKRAARDLARLGRQLAGGTLERVCEEIGVEPATGFTREHLRAAAAAYVADLRWVRSHLSAAEILAEVYEEAARDSLLPRPYWPRIGLYRIFRRYWRAHGAGSAEVRRAAWRATVHDRHGVASALRIWGRHGDRSRERGEHILARLLRHPERVTDQLVTLRTVQTLSLIDLLNYRGQVFRLGRYADTGNDPGTPLM